VTRREQLEALWARIPEVACRGLCQSYCGPIAPGRFERRLVAAEAGRKLGATHGRCDLLDAEGRCTGYAARPTICRLWAAAEGMACPWGCKPAGGRLMPREAALELLGAVLALTGEDGSEVALRSRRATLAHEAESGAALRPGARNDAPW
jgi:hypothetical protein